MARKKSGSYAGEVFKDLVAEHFGVQSVQPLSDVPLPDTPLTSEQDDEAQGAWTRNSAPYRDAHVVSLRSWFQMILSRIKELIDSTKRVIDDSVTELRAANQRYESAIARNSSAELARKNSEDRLRREFEMIRRFDKIREIKIETDKIIITTTNLIMSAPDGSFWDIGPWEIHISRNADPRYIKCFSLRSRVRIDHANWVHPHVDRNGNVCWGNAAGPIGDALSRAEYDMAIQLIVAVLESGRDAQLERADPHGYVARLREIGDRVEVK